MRQLQLCESQLNKFTRPPIQEGGISTRYGGNPTHENLTILSIAQSKILKDVDNNYKERIHILFRQGVVWNDDPTVLLWKDSNDNTAQSFEAQWLALFGVAKMMTKLGYSYTNKDHLLGRSHFGDLQFLHSMATKNCEKSNATLEKIMLWAEFTYKVGTGRISRETKLRNVIIKGFTELFINSKYYDQPIDILFNRDNVREMALGSLLHMIQDSYFDGHTSRIINNKTYFSKGSIQEFHAYPDQNGSHKKDDAWPNGLIDNNDKNNILITHNNPTQLLTVRDAYNPISTGAKILEMADPKYDNYPILNSSKTGKEWKEVKNYLLEHVFHLDSKAQPAWAGKKYTKKTRPECQN